MAKRGVRRKSTVKKKNGRIVHPSKLEHHPLFRQELTIGQRLADWVANFGGSWTFILIFSSFLVIWMIFNTWYLTTKAFDPYPYILLNLVLSCLAAFQAPIILMTQNRQGERDRIDAKYDHAINRKAEREIQKIQKDLDAIRRYLRELKKK
ncbi:TPA: DUF1003 domain-containing protein [Candidatus Woesearchaeota archaeon]|nr:hypothetical protein [archaeon]HIJ11516.1 DUF1003 domain-containing protein [Candidatus Woesearchaeota archaeon]